jgi:hypothetical protein
VSPELWNLDPEAAFMSASWGRFQIMGFNYKAAGYHSVDQFVLGMRHSEGKQLAAFVSFIKSEKLEKYLQKQDWVGFANRYNGPKYKYDYGRKISIEYNKLNR